MSDEGEQRCHGGCNSQSRQNGAALAWDAISRPQTQCQTSQHRPVEKNPESLITKVAQIDAQLEWNASHINALSLKAGGELVPFVLVMDAATRQAYKDIATGWEKNNSRILQQNFIPSFGTPATPIFSEGDLLVAYCQSSTFTTGVFGVRVFDVSGNLLGGQTTGELGLGEDELGNELVFAVTTLGVSIAVGVARRIVTMAATMAIRSTVRVAAGNVLAAVGRAVLNVFAWRKAGGAAIARLEKTMTNLLQHELTRSARMITKPEVFRHSLSHPVTAGIPYANIEREGAMRLSKGATAHYGEGVYAWQAGATGVGKFIDIEVSGVAVEQLIVKNAMTGSRQVFVRLVPATGDTVAVKIVGTNLTKEEIEFGRNLIAR
jgi:hypothetical protein